MTPLWSEILDFAPEAVFLGALIFARIASAISVLPAFGEQALPMRVKLSAAVAFSLIVGPATWAEIVVADFGNRFFPSLISEVFVGLLLGLSLRVLIIGLQVAGSIASQTISLSQLFGAGVGPEPQPAFSTLLVIAALAFAVIAGLHVKVASMFILSYKLFPVGLLIDPSSVAAWGANHVSQMFALGLTLAAPFVLAATIYNVGLGFISRAMPQLMVAFVGAPAISLAGLVLFMLATPIMISTWYGVFETQLLSPRLGFE